MPQGYKPFEAAKQRYQFIELRKERVPIEILTTYLHAADAFFVHRQSEPQAVRLSSMIYTVLGAGCPTLAYDTDFVEDVHDVIIPYQSPDDFQAKLEDVFERKEYVREILKRADIFAEKHSAEKLSAKYLELFRSLLSSEVKGYACSV
jgi:glycosyltransferase involved in cell wall biosynthesis